MPLPFQQNLIHSPHYDVRCPQAVVCIHTLCLRACVVDLTLSAAAQASRVLRYLLPVLEPGDVQRKRGHHHWPRVVFNILPVDGESER